MRLAVAVAAVALISSGCADGLSGSPGTSEPTITAVSVGYASGWSPAWSPPVDVLTTLRDALRQGQMWMLLPSAPPDASTGELSAAVQISQRVPVGGSEGSIVLRRPDDSVYVSVQSVSANGKPICDAPLGDPLYLEWEPATVRGEPGCSLFVPEAISFVAWTEQGENFIAQFGPDVDMAGLIQWLGDWDAA